MDNNELDKVIKEKLKGQIMPSKEFEQKIQNTIKEQKQTYKKSTNNSNYAKLKVIVSMVAVALIAFILGISLKDDGISFEEKTVTIAAITDIKPTKSSNEVLASDSEFLIYAEGENLTEESVQKVIYIEPALEYNISKTNNANEYKLTFKQNIPNNTIVKLQYVKDKITQDSWAYQTSTELSINGTYPAKGETLVSKDTVIEIEFSHAAVENLEERVEISPKITGRWEHLGKIWRFIPAQELSEETYYVKVKKGIIAEQKTLKNEYTFSFTVGEWKPIEYIYNSISIDKINTYKTDEAVRIYCSGMNTKLEISKIKIAKLGNKEEFINYLKNKDYKNATNLGEYKFEQTESYVQLTKGLETGYYVAKVYGANKNEIFNCPIQINDLSAYAMGTERDVLVWVANNENLAQDIEVEYQGKILKTDNKGLVEFNDITSNSKEIEYVSIGNNSNQLVVGIYNHNLDNYPQSYLYTDRPLYKNTDIIKIWGFVPLNQFYDKVENEFYIELNGEGKQKVKVEKDGNLNYSIELKNHMDGSCNIWLYYKDTIIGSRNVEIKNYEAQNYTYEIIYKKNYALAGTNYEFDVKINHITGLVVPNKTIRVQYEGKTYREVSGEDGIAHFKIKIPEKDIKTTYAHYSTITIYNGDLEEYTEKEDSITLYVLYKDVYTNQENTDKNIYKAAIYKLDTDKNEMVSYDVSKIYNGTYETTVNIKLKETIYRRYISGYVYDEYTKENKPMYSWTESEKLENLKTVNTKNGILEINAKELNLKKATEEENYSYSLLLEFKDQSGRIVNDNIYIHNEDDENIEKTIGYVYQEGENSDGVTGVNYNYYAYRYFLNCDEKVFSIGDTMKLTFQESTIDGNKEINNEGKILRIVLQEDIYQKEIIENNNLDYTFTESDFPGCKITSAYFYKGKFYRMPSYYFDFKEQDRKVDVEIKSDKEKYNPRDEVTLTIKTTNNGKPVKTFVNISVVNKAVLQLNEDYTNLLETIYRNKTYPIYTFSTYRDYIAIEDGGAGAGGDLPRGKFGDTAYFETVYTDSKGTAIVKFKLPDNVTTYRVTAHSANENLYLGVNTIDITSTLDFFIQYTEPRDVKTSDDLVLNATSVAEEKYNVDYEFTIKELERTLTTTASTNTIATANFGKLPYGTYTAVIRGKAGENQDAIEYKFNIIESAQEVKHKETVNITDGVEINLTKNPITIEIYNKEMEQYIKYIDFIEKKVSTRLDTQIAYNEVQKIKNHYYNTTNPNTNINIYNYWKNGHLKNLPNGEADIVFTALVSYYSKGYYEKSLSYFSEMDNLFENYLLAAANNEPVLKDLLYLKEENDITNYNKLLVTLSLEFLGDFQNAKQLYSTIEITNEEEEEYKSIIAIIETFISKESANTKINELIENKPADEYLRFAILSFFKNNSVDIEKESEVKVITKNMEETVKLNGMQIKTLTINNEDLSTIKFETESKELMVSYYYQTLLDNVETENISKDIKISTKGEMKKGNTVTLVVEFTNQFEGPVRIALPNSLRIARIPRGYNYSHDEYYVQNNQIDYITLFKKKECTRMEIPLDITYEGSYKFENVVCNIDGIYHISNSIDLNISE